jgi:GNAT superfamily N-acetyltransferase
MTGAVVELVRGDGALESFRSMLERYQEGLPQDLRVVDLAAELGELEARYAAPEAAMFLATVSSAAAGCVAVKRFDARTAEIKRLFVAPEFRGKGAARVLMESAVAFARELGCERVALDTERDRLRPAYELYRSLGFVHCDPYTEAEYANATFMELSLHVSS